MHALVEENARRTVKLRNDNSLGTVDDKRTCGSHVRDVPKVDVLHAGVKVLVLRVRAGKAEFCLQRNIVGKSSLKTLLNCVLGRIDEVVYEGEFIVVPRVLNRENFLENLIQSLAAAAVRSGFQLEEVLERLELNLQKVRVFQNF
jgi:hypothetical protein